MATVAERVKRVTGELLEIDPATIENEASFTVEPMGIALSLDDPRLANLVQTYLDALAQSGALESARDFWFRDESWVGSIR